MVLVNWILTCKRMKLNPISHHIWKLTHFQLLAWRRLSWNFLFSSWIWVHLTPTTSTKSPKFDHNKIKVVYLRYTGGEVSATSAMASKISLLGLYLKTLGDDIAKATSNCKDLRITVRMTIQNRLTIQNGQTQTEVVTSASSLISKALTKPPWNGKEGKKNYTQCKYHFWWDFQHCLTDVAPIFS